MLYDRDTLIRDLRRSTILVTFIKENGERRQMRCTLQPDLLPEKYRLGEIAEEKKFHTDNKDTIRVWDLDVRGWRSFKIEGVTYVEEVDAFT